MNIDTNKYYNYRQKAVDWYNPTNIKSCNKYLNFIIGGRGIGKTYGFKKYCISRYKKKGKQTEC